MTEAAANQEEFLSMGVDQAQYEALERDFRDVLSAMVGEKSMERFRTEYEKLHRALKTSYESEKRLVKRCKELNDTIVGNATRVKAALKLTQEDSSTITVLKREVDRAWRLVEQAKEKEEKARKIIQDLKGEIAHLHKIVEQGSGLTFSQDNNVQQMLQQKQALQQQLKQKDDHVADLELAKASIQEHANRLEAELLGVKEQHKKQVITNEEQATEITRMTRTIDNGKEEKNAAEKKKKEQEAAHTELQKAHEQARKDKAVLEEKNDELQRASQDLQRKMKII